MATKRPPTRRRRSSTGLPGSPNSISCWSGRRRTPVRATRSRPRGGGCRWSRWTPPPPVVGADGPGYPARRVRGPQAAVRLLPHVARGRPAAEQCEGCTFFTGQARSCPICTPAMSPTRPSVRARTPRAPATGTSWAGTCRGTRRPSSADALIAGRRVRRCGLLSARRRPRLRDLLDDRPRLRGRWRQLPRARPDRLRPPGDLGGLTRGLAAAVAPAAGEQFRTDGRRSRSGPGWPAGRSDDLTG